MGLELERHALENRGLPHSSTYPTWCLPALPSRSCGVNFFHSKFDDDFLNMFLCLLMENRFCHVFFFSELFCFLMFFLPEMFYGVSTEDILFF